MTKAQLAESWQHLRLILKNARRQVELVPADKFDFRPTPDVRSVLELSQHMFAYLTIAPEILFEGKYIEKTESILHGKNELLAWIDGQIATAYASFDALTDAQISATYTVWGENFEGWKLLSGVFDEVVHHRGQLTVYLRLMGITPIMIYDF